MTKLKFPLVEGKQDHWPDNPICPICGRSKVSEPNSFAVLGAGAFLMDRKTDCSILSEDLEGFLSIYWHGAHDGGVGENPEAGFNVDIIKDALGGEASLYFCSTACLRTFFNLCVDALESGIKKDIREMKQEVERKARRKKKKSNKGEQGNVSH
jgi:hypothetical protein